jgi:hypothetical protein
MKLRGHAHSEEASLGYELPPIPMVVKIGDKNLCTGSKKAHHPIEKLLQ